MIHPCTHTIFSLYFISLFQTFLSLLYGRGCGAFGGDPQLKFLIQWLASSQSGRSMKYCSFNDKRVSGLSEFIQLILDRVGTVGRLFKLLRSSLEHCAEHGCWQSVARNLESSNRHHHQQKRREISMYLR